MLKGFEYYGDQIGIYATEDLKIVLEGIENLFSIEHAGAILGQPSALPQLRAKTLRDGALAPLEPCS